MPYKDKEKQRECWRRWRRRNRKKDNKRVNDRKKEIKKWFRKYKENLKCNRCPENHPSCIDFHHNGEKDFDVSFLVAKGYSKNRILEELKKCEVLCANCHRKEHWSNLGLKPL